MAKSITDEEIFAVWNDCQAIKRTARKLNISESKARKSLSTCGIIINETHRMILSYHNQGKTIEEISAIMQMSERVVQSYLPRSRPPYNVNPSGNARRIKKCREKLKK